MKITARTQWQNRLQRMLTVVLLLAVIGGLAALSQQSETRFDWTHGARSSLSEPSRELVRETEGPIRFVVFLGDNPALRERVRSVIKRYQAVDPAIELDFINPDLNPEESRAYGVQEAGEVFVRIGDRRERVERFSEAGITNAIARAARAGERFVVFARGHGEADPLGPANHDLGQLGEHLADRGLRLQRSHIARDGIPENTAALVIAGPRESWLPDEIERVREWLENGGNLLWLVDPHGEGIPPLADTLGVGLPDGTVKDESGRMVNVDDPGMVLIYQYGDDPVTGPMQSVTLLPHSTLVDGGGMDDWDRTPILPTSDDAWLESPEGEQLMGGPFHLGTLMTREVDEDDVTREQRVAVIGSQAFLSNAFIGNGANLELGTRLFNWVSDDPVSLAVPVRSAPDRKLDLSRTAYGVIGSLFLLGLPALFLAGGVLVWWRRRG